MAFGMASLPSAEQEPDMSSTQENYRLDRHAVDAEHEAQIGLVEALVSAVENPAQAPAASMVAHHPKS